MLTLKNVVLQFCVNNNYGKIPFKIISAGILRFLLYTVISRHIKQECTV